jgi:hypothetical protein
VAALSKLLTDTYGDRVEVQNLAQPATTGSYVVNLASSSKLKPHLEEADLIIVEYQFNEMFSRDNLAKQHDKLGYMLLNLPQKPALLFFDLSGAKKMHKHWEAWEQFPTVEKSLHYNVAKRFEIPIVWFSDVERQMNFSVNWLNPTHPDCAAHDVFAKVMYDVMQDTMTRVCEQGVQGKDTVLPDLKDETWQHCAGFGKLQAHASLGEKSFPVKNRTLLEVAISGDWKFQEDEAGKPGWIASKGSQKEIVFTKISVQYGGLTIEYLRTYENAGVATCTLETQKEPRTVVKRIVLNGLWDKCASLEATDQFFDIPAGTYDLRCRSNGQKFKLLGLQTC